MCMPRSQNAVMERPAFSQLWQDYELPGSLTFGSKNPLPPGSAVIVHSALLHGRRAQPGGDPNKPRYFIDISYCQPGPSRWPNYGRGWETQREINQICMDMGHDRPATPQRDGQHRQIPKHRLQALPKLQIQ